MIPGGIYIHLFHHFFNIKNLQWKPCQEVTMLRLKIKAKGLWPKTMLGVSEERCLKSQFDPLTRCGFSICPTLLHLQPNSDGLQPTCNGLP